MEADGEPNRVAGMATALSVEAATEWPSISNRPRPGGIQG